MKGPVDNCILDSWWRILRLAGRAQSSSYSLQERGFVAGAVYKPEPRFRDAHTQEENPAQSKREDARELAGKPGGRRKKDRHRSFQHQQPTPGKLQVSECRREIPHRLR